jgi:4'-phosphopantetheinyl transferase
LAALSALAKPEQLRGFYRCWTRKEAFIKAIGTGLSLPLDLFDVTIGEPAAFLAFRNGEENPEQWTLADVSPGPSYIAALAARQRGLRVRTFALRTP